MLWQLSGQSGTSRTKPTPAPSGPITLNFWGIFDEPATFQPIIDAYQKEHPNVRVIYTTKDATLYEFASLNLLASQEGPDVWLIPMEWLPKHRNKLSPVPEGFLANQNIPPKPKKLFSKASPQPSNIALYPKLFAPITQSENIVDNNVYTLPLSVDTLGLFGNSTLLQAAGVERLPLSWDELVEVVKKITSRNGATIAKPAIALGTSNNVTRSTDILATLMIQNHTPMINDARNEALYNQMISKATGEPIEPGLAALDFYTSFASPTKETYTWSPSFPPDFDAFTSGNLPFFIDYSFRIQDIIQKAPTLPLVTGALPQIAGTDKPKVLATSLAIGVPTVSKKQREAWNFIGYLTNKSNSLAYARATGRPPARLDLASDPTFDPRLAPFIAQIPIATSWYRNEINKTSDVFHLAIDAVLAGRTLPDVMGRLTKQVTHILRNESYE